MTVNICEFVLGDKILSNVNLPAVPVVNDMITYGSNLYIVMDRNFNLDTHVWSIYLEDTKNEQEE